MREIKFRQWSSDRFHYWGRNPDSFTGPLSNRLDIPSEQFTGLYDENGKEIYEGDIISGGILAEPCEVMFQESCGRFIAFGVHYKVLAHKFDQFEVIGNIHENPELLEVTK